MRLTLLAFLLFSGSAMASLSISVGAGKAITDNPPQPFERAVALGYQIPLGMDVFARPEAGYFLDISGGDHLSSWWAGAMLGVQALSKNGTEIHIGVGPAYLENPDGILGGHFQFTPEFGIGISSEDVYIGVAWKHLSSAGFEMPNIGRDFITLQLRLLKI